MNKEKSNILAQKVKKKKKKKANETQNMRLGNAHLVRDSPLYEKEIKKSTNATI